MIKTTLAALALSLMLTLSAMADSNRVNLNTASAEQLAMSLTGVGQSRAEAIVRYREQYGAFEHIDELINVAGIGLRTVDINRDRLTLSDD
jgi:competence protein ComEA